MRDEDLPDGISVELQLLHPLSIRQLLVNYLRAVERFRIQCERAKDPDHHLHAESLGYAALAEALDWADSIDNYLREGPRGSVGTNRDKDWAEALPPDQNELVLAFQRVRNLVHHRWWQAVATRLGDGGDGDQANKWIWGRLPESPDQARRRSAIMDAAYESRLGGMDVLATLDDLAQVFWSKRRWEIRRQDINQPGHVVASPIVFDDE